MAVAKKPVAVAKKAEVKKEEVKAVVAPAAKTEVKAETKVEEKKEAPAAKKATAKKEAAPKKETAKKTSAKKEAAPKKETAKKAEKANLFVQFQGRDYAQETLINMAKEAYKAAGNKSAIKTLNVYANVDDQVAYYVVNDSFEGSFNI